MRQAVQAVANNENTVIVSKEFVEDVAHALGSLAQFFLDNCAGGDVKREEALIMQACEYLRQQGYWK